MGDITQFLQESNWIENEFSSKALEQSLQAWGWMIGQSEITSFNLRQAHQLLMEGLLSPIEAGGFRTVHVRVGNRMCPAPDLVPSLVEDWISVHSGAKTEEEIKQAHIAFEHVHPFIDGNGRVGRILMNWQRVKNNLPILIIHTGYEQRSYYQWFREN